MERETGRFFCSTFYLENADQNEAIFVSGLIYYLLPI